MQRWFSRVVMLLVFGSGVISWCGVARGQDKTAGPREDPRVLAEKVVQACGGQAAWDTITQLSYRCIVIRNEKTLTNTNYGWNRKTGEFLIENKSENDLDQVSFTILPAEQRHLLLPDRRLPVSLPHTTLYRDGKILRNGQPLTGEEADRVIREYYERSVLETFWLFSPFFLLQPETDLKDVSELSDDQGTYQVLTFSSRHPLLAGAKYDLLLDRETHLPVRWKIHREGVEKPMVFVWDGYETFGSLKLSTRRFLLGEYLIIWYPIITME